MRTDVMYAVPEQEITSSPAKEITPAYRPPGAVEEPPENLSKSALKNKKRREAAKNNAKVETETNGAATKTLEINQETNNCQGIPSDPDKEKKIRKLNEKIQSIQRLKQAHSEGKPLEKNQIEKLSKEQELMEELEALKMS